MRLFNKVKSVLRQDAINQIHSCSKSTVNVNGVRVVVTDNLIKVKTDHKPYTIVVDGEVVRRQMG